MGREALICKPIRRRLFGERQIAVINKQFVFTILAIDISGITHVDIQQTIAVDISYADTGWPDLASFYSSLIGNVFKRPVAVIDK